MASFDLGDAERQAWSNLPATIVSREGLAFGEMSADQLALMHAVWAAGYSETGWTRAQGVIDNEQYNEDLGDPNFDSDLYYITIFDEPSAKTPWALQLDGHHLVSNFTVVGDRFDMVPAFWGVSPTEVTDGQFKGLRPLGDTVDAGLAFMQSIEALHDQAWISEEDHAGLVVGPGMDGRFPDEHDGVPASGMTEAQRAALLELIGLHVQDLQSTQASARMEEVEAGLDETYFAWFGPIDEGAPWYFRIEGPTVWIELDHVNATHVHTVYRDPHNDYGSDWLKTHRSSHPHL